MVNATKWLEENYPIFTRKQITELDISSKGLEGVLNLTEFTNLKKLNASFNEITELWWYSLMEEADISYNRLTSSKTIGSINDPFKKFNLSNNRITELIFIVIPQLTHLDFSNNLVTDLDLRTTRNLVELNCSGNPLNNLTLNNSPNLTLFDCLGVQLVKTSTVPVITTTLIGSVKTITATSVRTAYANNPALVNSTISLATFSGVSLIGWIVLSWVFIFKRFFGRVIPTAGGN